MAKSASPPAKTVTPGRIQTAEGARQPSKTSTKAERISTQNSALIWCLSSVFEGVANKKLLSRVSSLLHGQSRASENGQARLGCWGCYCQGCKFRDILKPISNTRLHMLVKPTNNPPTGRGQLCIVEELAQVSDLGSACWEQQQPGYFPNPFMYPQTLSSRKGLERQKVNSMDPMVAEIWSLRTVGNEDLLFRPAASVKPHTP